MVAVDDWSPKNLFGFLLSLTRELRRGEDTPTLVRWPLSSTRRLQMRLTILGVAVMSALGASLPARAAGPVGLISGVSVSAAFFNPSIGQLEKITFTVGHAGTAQLEIIDRDRFLIRKLGPLAVQPGPVSVSWDGRDEAGLIVPDEAYAIRITFSGEGATDLYDPTEHFQSVPQDLTSCTYSRTEGVLAYTLPWPARVHILAGQATQDPTTHVTNGPVLKAVVDRQPRTSGAVVENWNGFDESGTIYVPDLPHFVVAITIAPLPENAVIAVGNRDTVFFEYAQRHRPKEALMPRKHDGARHAHHVGLSAFEDHNVPLRLAIKAPFDPASHAYRTKGEALKVTLTLEPRRAPYFLTSLAELDVFVDEKLVSTQKASRSPVQLSVVPDSLPAGRHRVAFNWASGLGPAAVTAVQVDVGAVASPQQPGKH